jgi:hypothetical protein
MFFIKGSCNISCAFITYVRPVLEFASSVWSPCHVTDVHKIEAVQRRFNSTRLPGFTAVSYSTVHQVGQLIELDSLDLMLLCLDLVLAYKLIFELVDGES